MSLYIQKTEVEQAIKLTQIVERLEALTESVMISSDL